MMSDWKWASGLRMKNRLPRSCGPGVGAHISWRNRASGACVARDLALIHPFLHRLERTLLLLDELAQLLHLGFQLLDLGRDDRLARLPFCLRVSRALP